MLTRDCQTCKKFQSRGGKSQKSIAMTSAAKVTT